ncbi:MAG: hypothetical protein V3U02_02340 [Calditrichia bacterium]
MKCKDCKHKFEELTYEVGQRFKVHDDEFIFARCGKGLVIAISLDDGNCWGEVVKVSDSDAITPEESNRILPFAIRTGMI